MTFTGDPCAPPLQGEQVNGDPGDCSYYTWASLVGCSTAITAAMAVTIIATSSFLNLLLASLVSSLCDSHNLDIHLSICQIFFILSGAGDARMAGLSRAAGPSVRCYSYSHLHEMIHSRRLVPPYLDGDWKD